MIDTLIPRELWKHGLESEVGSPDEEAPTRARSCPVPGGCFGAGSKLFRDRAEAPSFDIATS